MQKTLLWVLAMMMLVACSKNDEMDSPYEGGEKEQSYLAVSLMADDMTTRADDGQYEEGDASERVVESLYFFLFDEEGSAFRIDDGKLNYKSVEINETDNTPDVPDNEEDPNVSDLKNKVLVFENHKGEYPAKIVAVINWEPAPGAVYTLDDLADNLSGLKNSAGAFVMSNAVYAAESEYAGAKKEAIKATALSASNIGKTKDEALANPVKIYVERISAKVTVNTSTENKYDIGKEVNGKDVYAEVLGWELFNEYENSTLLKNIDPEWTDTEIGFSWNNAPWFRSYWAISPNPAFVDAENMVSYNSLSHSIGGSDYCGENTYNPNSTKVVVKARLIDESNNPVEVATWYGNDYLGEEALRTVVANTIAAQLYYFDGVEYKSIKPEHLKVVEADEPNPDTSADLEAYHVFFQLSTVGESKVWYTYSSVEGFKPATVDAVNIILGGVEPALLYKNGQTYYYTDIKHLPSTVDATEFGIVRNHVYKVNITSIAGFGTPVYDGDTNFNPMTPEDVTTYVSAEIRILSWRVVKYDYDL